MANISQVQLPDNSIYDIVPVINPNNTVIDASVYVGPYPLNENSLCMVATDGKLYPFVQTLGTGTGTTYPLIPTTIKFRIGTDVFAAGKAYDGSAGAIDVSTLAISEEVDIRYSSRRLTGASGTSYSAIPAGQHNEIYMYISIQPTEGTFNLICDYMDGYGASGDYIVNILAKEKVKANTFCMFLGYSSKYSAYRLVWLSPEHPIYYCDSERNFIPYDTWRNNIQDTSISLIDTSIANIESVISSGSIYFAKTTSNSGALATLVSIPGVTAYYEGLKIALYYTVSTSSSTSVTLKVNDLAAKRIYAKANTDLSQGLAVNSINYLCYVGTASDGYFILDRDINTDTNTLAYKNPVAGYNITSGDIIPHGECMFKATSAIKAQLVFEGEDNSIYSIAQSDVSVNPDWGLAYWSAGRNGSSALTVNNVIQQESLVIADTCIGLDITKAMQYFPVYAWFKYTNNTIKTTATSSRLHSDIPPATDLSNDTYVYVGTVECVDDQAKYLHMDLSNHDFITIDYDSDHNPVITHINGRSVEGGGGNVTYDNPVSPDSYILSAGDNLHANTLIFKGSDGVGYPISETRIPIDTDWGLGYLTRRTDLKNFTEPNTVMQQCLVNSSSGGIYYLNNNIGDDLYLCCDFVINQVYSLYYISTYDNCKTYHTQNGQGDFTYIYIGTVATIDPSSVSDSDKRLALDLSNHDFITLNTTIESAAQKPKIKAINGKLLLDTSGGGDSGWDGICHNAQTYSYLSNRTVDPNSYHYPCAVIRYENKAFLYTLDSSERGAYVAYAHVTVHNDDNIQHTVEISLCANSVGLTSTEPVAPVWSDINQRTTTYLEIPPYRSATAHMTTPVRYDYKDGSPELLGYGFVIRNDENRHCSIIGAHEASIIVAPLGASNVPDTSIVHQTGRQFYRAAQFDISGEKPQYAWCSSGVINSLSAAGIIIYTSDDTQAVTPGYTTVDGSTVIAVFKGINPSTGGGVTGTTCGVYQIGTGFGYDGNSYSYVSVPAV